MPSQKLNPIILIPSRLAATRLPNKPLLDINGKSMILRVWECAMKAGIGDAVIAAGDQAIVDEITQHGGKAVLTDPALPSGSDRIWAALQAVDPSGKYNVVVNLQGDLPSVDAKTLQATLNLLNDEAVDIGTPVIKIKDTKEIENPNVVKASFSSPLVGEAGWGVASANSEGQHSARGETPLPTLPTRGRAKINSGRALAFSRAAIPANDGNYYHHIGIYAYRRKALEKFVHLPPSENEKREKLEQLRAMDAGMRIDVAIVDAMPMTIDTPEDLERARKIIR